MDKKVTGILAYISLIGWLIAYLAGDKEGAKFHLNQGLVLDIAAIIVSALSRIPIVSIVAGLLSIAILVLMIMGIIYAAKEEDKELPLVGAIKILK